MGLESGNYISDLVATNPPGTDPKSQGDDHLRLIKDVLKKTFPDANSAIKFNEVSLVGNGYVKLPGGLIVQWGLQNIPGDPTTYSFPTPFHSSIFSIVASIRQQTAAASANAINTSLSEFQLSAVAFEGGYTAVAVNWIALGY